MRGPKALGSIYATLVMGVLSFAAIGCAAPADSDGETSSNLGAAERQPIGEICVTTANCSDDLICSEKFRCIDPTVALWRTLSGVVQYRRMRIVDYSAPKATLELFSVGDDVRHAVITTDEGGYIHGMAYLVPGSYYAKVRWIDSDSNERKASTDPFTLQGTEPGWSFGEIVLR